MIYTSTDNLNVTFNNNSFNNMKVLSSEMPLLSFSSTLGEVNIYNNTIKNSILDTVLYANAYNLTVTDNLMSNISSSNLQTAYGLF
jgi:hypothetical protein